MTGNADDERRERTCPFCEHNMTGSMAEFGNHVLRCEVWGDCLCRLPATPAGGLTTAEVTGDMLPCGVRGPHWHRAPVKPPQ